MAQTNLFNTITKLAKHLKYNSSLQKFNDVIDWEIFRDNSQEKNDELKNHLS